MKMQRYTGVAIGLHWLIGLMILGSFGIGLYMVDLYFRRPSCVCTPGTNGLA